MIDLYKYINESIFDDEEEQLDRVGASVGVDQLKRGDSLFYQEWKCYEGRRGAGVEKTAIWKMKDVSYDKGTLFIPTINFERIDTRDTHALSHYVEGTKELVCCSFRDGSRGELSPNNLCNKVTCSYFYKNITSKVKDIDIVIDPKYIEKVINQKSFYRPDVIFSGFDRPILENVTIDFVGAIPGGDIGKHIGFHNFPTFKNTKSNVTYISVYDAMSFDEDDLDKLFPIFEWPHKATIRDFNKHEDVEITIKGLKKAKAIANNPKRYHPITQIFKLKKGAKLSDVIDTSGFKYLLRFAYRDNNVNLIFSKTPLKSMLLCEPEPLRIETHQMTDDGYYVCLECDK